MFGELPLIIGGVCLYAYLVAVDDYYSGRLDKDNNKKNEIKNE